jgi:hypothetical protein
MRRGLLHWDPQEVPLPALEARIARLRAAMRDAGLDAFILYTNIARPSGVAWLTGFTPYWSESLLLVPRDGRLVFATAMTNRVADWIRSTNPVSDVTSTPKPGVLIGEALAKDGPNARVGVLELDALPSELADHLAAAAPAATWIDGSELFAGLRRTVDDTERGLIARADAIAIGALSQIDAGKATDAGTLAGLVEQHARLAGAEEAYIAVAPDLTADRRLIRVSKPLGLAARFAVRASVAYKGSWVRRTRTFARDKSTGRLDAWFNQATASLEPDKAVAAQLLGKLTAIPGAQLKGWTVERCVGSYPLEPVDSSREFGTQTPNLGGFLVLSAEVFAESAPWIGAAPLIVGTPKL